MINTWQTENTDRSVILDLILPSKLVNDVVDCLLGQTPKLFFSVVEMQGYGQPQEHLTVREQVAGYQQKVKVQIECLAERAPSILADLKQQMPNATLSYRVTPILQHGQL
jgi:hypothetical protein